LNYIGLASIVTLGLVLLTGIGGLTSFGQAAFVGLGAYTTAVLTTQYGVSPWLTLPAGLALTFVVALCLGFITLRLSGHYLPLGTIAWGMAIYFLFGNLDMLGKYSGLAEIPPLRVLGWTFGDSRAFYYLIWAVTLLALLAMRNLLDSRSGRAIRALRSRSLMAENFGVDTARLAPNLLPETVGVEQLVCADRDRVEPVEQAEIGQFLDGMRQRIDADAELADGVRLLENLAIDPARMQHQRRY